MNKVRFITFRSNGGLYGFPARLAAEDRAKYYAARDKETTFDEEFEFTMQDNYEAVDWFRNNMDPTDVAEHLRCFVQPNTDNASLIAEGEEFLLRDYDADDLPPMMPNKESK